MRGQDRLCGVRIFHVPFEKRHLVGNQRYSIAGLPCLYLGSSLWICWEELGRPDLDKVWISRFRFAKEVKVLDFQYPPHLLWRIFQAIRENREDIFDPAAKKALLERFNDRLIASYILIWPLIAACSIKVESKEGYFYPQYIIPQTLLQWVTREGIVDGIRYFSTQTPYRKGDAQAHSNCVFPAKTSARSGQCEVLRSMFTLTDPVSWEPLRATNIRTLSLKGGPDNSRAIIRLSSDFRVSYMQTSFYDAESKLSEIEETQGCSLHVDE